MIKGKRKNVTLTTTVNPAVLRAVRRIQVRDGYEGRRGGSLVNRLLVCWLLSSKDDRRSAAMAGCYDSRENKRERDEHLDYMAKYIADYRTPDQIPVRVSGATFRRLERLAIECRMSVADYVKCLAGSDDQYAAA